MIPNLPLLQRTPYYSRIAGAIYDPFTLFIRYTMDVPFIVRPEVRYNISEDLNDESSKFFQEVVKHEAASFHEEFHWLQHNSTTVGAFLTLLRYSQERTTINFLTDIQPGHLSEMLKNRFGENPVPIVPLGSEGELDRSRFSEEDQLALFRQIWHDHQLIYTILDSSNLQDEISYPRGQVFGEVIGDAILHFCDRCGYEYPGNELAREWFRFDDEEIFFVAAANQRLTTRGIIEGVTVANELQLVYLRGTSGKHIMEFADQLDNGSYGTALTAFILKLELKIQSLDDLISIFPTFNTICDIALNPPLPPSFIGPPKNRERWSWHEIYPPYRFVSLIEAVKKIDLLPLNSKHNDLRNYIEMLCDHLNWYSPLNYAHPFLECKKTLNFDRINYDREEDLPKSKKGLKDFRIEDLAGFDYYHYLLWVQYRMWNEKKNNLPFFINQAECRMNPEIYHYYLETALRSWEGSIWMKPPFVWLSNDSYAFTTSFKNFNYWLLNSSCLQYFLFDLVVGTGKFNTSVYPPQMKARNIFDTVRKGLERTFAIKLEEKILKRELPQRPLFVLGEIVGTPKAVQAFERNNVRPEEYILRHVIGDWGRVGNYYDITLTKKEHAEGFWATSDDGKLNNWGVEHDGTITNQYTLPDGTEIWITTVSDRSYTSLYLRSER